MEGRSAGMLLIAIGILAIVAGALVMTGALGWIGRLPGDIRIQSGGTRIYIPLMTMLVLSILLSLLMALLRRFL